MASATATINEALVIETELFAINVTDASAGDFVTCEVTGASTPADANTKFFIKFISGTAGKKCFVNVNSFLANDHTVFKQKTFVTQYRPFSLHKNVSLIEKNIM